MIEFRNAAFDVSPDGVLIRAGTALSAALAAALDGDAAPATALHFLESTPWWAVNCAAGGREEATRKAACLTVAGAFADAMRDSVKHFGRATTAEFEAAVRATPYKSLVDAFPAVAGALALNEVAVVLHDLEDDADDDDDDDNDDDDDDDDNDDDGTEDAAQDNGDGAVAVDLGDGDRRYEDEDGDGDDDDCCPPPAFDGGAVFPLVVMMNHSCPLPDHGDADAEEDEGGSTDTESPVAASTAAPPAATPAAPPAALDGGQNAEVLYNSSSAVASVVALRRIEVGEEITHAYADSAQAVKDAYGFDCRCRTCLLGCR